MIVNIYQAVLTGKRREIQALVQSALDSGMAAETILNEGLIAAMSELGDRFKEGKVYIPEVMLAGKTMTMATEVLKPHLVAEGQKSAVRVVLGTVQGDQHDIGKSLVKMMMEGQGIQVIDLGTNVSPSQF
ncbi:MAG TPA: cobalamin-binding protein, partial [Clostridiales bacterium]|nr:cobalamin-binding protein [Clostridiales bacterium]